MARQFQDLGLVADLGLDRLLPELLFHWLGGFDLGSEPFRLDMVRVKMQQHARGMMPDIAEDNGDIGFGQYLHQPCGKSDLRVVNDQVADIFYRPYDLVISFFIKNYQLAEPGAQVKRIGERDDAFAHLLLSINITAPAGVM